MKIVDTKKLRPNTDLDAAILRTKGIDHQNLVRIHDRFYYEEGTRFVIVMEYCSGEQILDTVITVCTVADR